MHDLGILVNTVACPQEFLECIQTSRQQHFSLDRSEEMRLGFTHCQSGKILAERWSFSADLSEAIEFHHNPAEFASRPLASLIHLSDLLCRLRDLGYGYYEAIGVHLAGDAAWAALAKEYPDLANTDLARLTMDIDGAMVDIVSLVDSVFRPQARPS